MGVFNSIANGARKLIGLGRKADPKGEKQEESMSDDPLDILLDMPGETVVLTPDDSGNLAAGIVTEAVVVAPPPPTPPLAPTPVLPPPPPPPPVSVTMTVHPAPAKSADPTVPASSDVTFMARFERIEKIVLGLSPEKIKSVVAQVVKGAVDEAIGQIAQESIRVGDELRASAKPLIEKAVSEATQAVNDRLDRFLRWFGAPESAT